MAFPDGKKVSIFLHSFALDLSPTLPVAQNNSFYHGRLEEQENRPSQQSYLAVFGKDIRDGLDWAPYEIP